MAKDLTIRLLGRPQVSKDNQLGYQTVRRRYAVQGTRANKLGIEDVDNPLFLAVGTPDDEFTDHYLVNQTLTPGDSMDKATLVRDYVLIRNTYASESITESGDFKRLTRRYVVLRTQNDTLGYGATEFNAHPKDPDNKNNDPYDYLPQVVKSTQPTSVTYTNDANSQPWGTDVSVESSEGVSLYDGLNDAGLGDGAWLPAGAQVSMAAPGVDVWTVMWVTHGKPYWTTATTKGGSNSAPTAIVRFDHNGLKVQRVSASGGSVSQAWTYVFYAIGENIPSGLVTLSGGSFNVQPSVNLDFQIKGYGGGGTSYKQVIPNAIFRNDSHIEFPLYGGGSTVKRVASKDTYDYEFYGYVGADAETYSMDGVLNPDYNKDLLPAFQGYPITHIGGVISYTHSYAPNASLASHSGTKIRPVFTSGTNKIWRVESTYVL